MTMKWFGLTENESALADFHSAFQRGGRLVHWYSSPQALRRQLEDAEFAVVFLHAGITYDIYQLSQDLSSTFPRVSVILLVAKADLDFKKAMRAGASDSIGLPTEEDEIIQTANVAQRRLQSKNPTLEPVDSKETRVITICGTKGGVGKTTLAVNLGVAFKKYNLKVAVLDVDLQFGDIAIMYALEPKKSLYELTREEHSNYAELVGKYMATHTSGVDILPAPLRPEYAEEITGEHILGLIDHLKTIYDIILIDTPPLLLETGLVALENSTDILLVTSMEIPTLKNSKLCMETLQSLGLKDRIKVILNRDSTIKGLRLDAVESILGTKIYSRIPSEGQVVVPSVNHGVPFAISHPRSSVTRSIFQLASQLLKGDKTVEKRQKEPKRSSLWSKILKRA